MCTHKHKLNKEIKTLIELSTEAKNLIPWYLYNITESIVRSKCNYLKNRRFFFFYTNIVIFAK